MRRLQALGNQVVLAPLDSKDQTDSGIWLGRSIDTPVMVVISVGSDCTPGTQEKRARAHVVSAARELSECLSRDVIEAIQVVQLNDKLTARLELLDQLRTSGLGKELQPGNLVMIRRDLSL